MNFPMFSKNKSRPDFSLEMLANDPLIHRLRMARRSDLDDLLRDLKMDVEKHRQKPDEEIVELVSRELRSVAGNSVVNLAREEHAFPYKQILIDVADKLHPGKLKWTRYKLDDNNSVENIEAYIHARLQETMEQQLQGMNIEERGELARRIEEEMRTKGYPEATIRTALSGVVAGTLSGVLLAGVMAPVILGTLWTTLFGFTLAQMAIGGAIAGGPIGVAIGAATLITSPSYSKTIPAVYRLIQIRLSANERSQLD